ncbi:TRAP transporter substrate-binding protein [Desulfitibacter alkalitolerans]|uniref:TRAP transporter substrate-binding protein n=1 Tax=Desulfitibacter alkalitolerans TaxID=264641 RepID=UPI0006870CE2|nr:TRAP transporter substrate-binding protein [Desulfitibacter alkalitolerans]
MLKKRNLVWILVLIIALVFTGCSEKKDETQQTDLGPTYNLKLGHNVTPGSAVDEGAKKFKEIVEAKTDGRITVEVFPSAQLGSEIDMVKNMGMGVIDIVIPGDGALGTYAPKFQGLVLPFLFDSIEHMDKVYAGEIGKELDATFRETANSTILEVWHRGPRNLTANEAKLTPDDLRGMKLRVTTIPIIVSVWEALGANPTPIAFPELFISLQQGVVDGQENPLDLIYTSNFHEVQSHVMLTQHTYSPWFFMINVDLYDGFPDDLRQKFDEALAEATEFQKQLVRESEDMYLQLLKDKGMQVIEVDRSLFMKKYEESGVEEKLAPQMLPNLVQRVKAVR